MFNAKRTHRSAVGTALAGPILVFALCLCLPAQQAVPAKAEAAQLPPAEATALALPLPEDRGQAALDRALKQLRTTASVMAIVAHPDDEDGSLLTYLSRGMGARVMLLTLTRGEGGQNAMSSDSDEAMGVIRTTELLKADEYYGAKQLWGTEVDFGFSKTQAESFAQWGHDRVLYDAVLAVRRERPQVIVATFLGGVSDGHGQHQVSGEIAQEVFKAAGDPNVFPEQMKDGLQPWQPLAVYSRAPFARITAKGIFDYATGGWVPAKFHNYITGEWTTGAPSVDVTIPVGTWDPVLGRSYVQIAQEGWGEQKSQYGGANPALSGPANAEYHLWGVAPEVAKGGAGESSLFQNGKVNIDTSIEGLAALVKGKQPDWLLAGLHQIQSGLDAFESDCRNESGVAGAHKLVPVYRQTLDLYAKVKTSDIAPEAKAGLEFELAAKIEQFQAALKELLELDMVAFTARGGREGGGNSARGGSADETASSVIPGEKFRVRIHTANFTDTAQLSKVWLESQSGSPWKIDNAAGVVDPPAGAPAATVDRTLSVQAAEDAEPTQPFFTTHTAGQATYDISNEDWRERSFAPYPLSAWAEFTFDGVPIRLGQVVQTLHRIPGTGGVYEPLVVTPAIGVRVEPEARLLPLDGSAVPVRVTVHAQAAAAGTADLKLPEGWTSTPAEAPFNLKAAGDSEPILFSVTPSDAKTGAYTIQAEAHAGGRTYETGWRSPGYPGLQPYNYYTPAQLKTRKVDVKLAPGLRVGYVMGTGDLVPQAIEELGVKPHLMTAQELATADLSSWNVLVIGIRAYTSLPELASLQPRLEQYVEAGGTIVVQYQSNNFPAPLPFNMERNRLPERVVDENSVVKLLDPANPLLNWPNKITPADFDGWVEERGHSFLDSWDPGYTALTETADAGQDPQRGGLLVTHPGKGTFIYVAYALYRQLPELVPGAYRILANLLSAGKESGFASN